MGFQQRMNLAWLNIEAATLRELILRPQEL
jgi:hypothetical protein